MAFFCSLNQNIFTQNVHFFLDLIFGGGHLDGVRSCIKKAKPSLLNSHLLLPFLFSSPTIVQSNRATSLFHAHVTEVHSRKNAHLYSAPENSVVLMDNFLFTETLCNGDLLVY